MRKQKTINKLRQQCFGAKIFPDEVLKWIQTENLWNLWVPKNYGGLERSLTEGLKELQSLAKIDGSLGWTITLCSGANYFIGNLQKEIRRDTFLNPSIPPCLGGSGGLFGTAEKMGDSYRLSGNWHYATGSSYLTHFTLNAKIIEEGKVIKKEDSTPKFRSFILPKNKVKIIENWNTMGLRATVTHSFEVNDVQVHEKYSFTYGHPRLPQLIFQIPFSLIADLTLWVNYLGMGEHFLGQAESLLPASRLKTLKSLLQNANQDVFTIAATTEQKIAKNKEITSEFTKDIHTKVVKDVRDLSHQIINIYPLLGIKACRIDHPVNHIFKDYFTATQHYIFSGK